MAETILHHKEESRQQSVGGRTRRAMLQNNDVLTPVEIFYKKCVELLEKVDAAVRKQLEADADGSDKLLKGLPLEASMVGHPFDTCCIYFFRSISVCGSSICGRFQCSSDN